MGACQMTNAAPFWFPFHHWNPTIKQKTDPFGRRFLGHHKKCGFPYGFPFKNKQVPSTKNRSILRQTLWIRPSPACPTPALGSAALPPDVSRSGPRVRRLKWLSPFGVWSAKPKREANQFRATILVCHDTFHEARLFVKGTFDLSSLCSLYLFVLCNHRQALFNHSPSS